MPTDDDAAGACDGGRARPAQRKHDGGGGPANGDGDKADADVQRRMVAALMADPRRCPNCGATDIATVYPDRLVSLLRDRGCTACGCVWSPRVPRTIGLLAFLLCVPFGLMCIYGLVFYYWRPGAGGPLDNLPPGVPWIVSNPMFVIKSILAPIGGLMIIVLGLYALQAARGRRGRPKIRRMGQGENSQEAGRPDEHAAETEQQPRCRDRA
jgi:hypothetical protein